MGDEVENVSLTGEPQGGENSENNPPQEGGNAPEPGQQGENSNNNPDTDNSDLPEFLRGVNPELARDSALQPIGDMESLVKGYINAQKMVGKNKITVPDEFASPDEWKEVFHKLGLPKDKNEYKVDFGESAKNYDDEFRNAFVEQAYEQGIMPKQAEGLFKFFDEQIQTASQQEQETIDNEYKKEFANLRQEWGAGFDKELEKAKVAFKQFADEDTTNYLKETGLDRNPKLIKLFNKIGSSLNEDTFDRETTRHLGVTKDEAQEQLNEINSNLEHAYWNPEHPNHKNAVEHKLKLEEILHS